MFKYIQRPVNKQEPHTHKTPLIAVKDAHVSLTRRVNVKNGWGGEVIATLDPAEHRVLCECVALRFIEMNDSGLFSLAPLGASFLEEYGDKSTYTFMDGENVIVLGEYELLMLQTAAYVESGVTGISNAQEIETIKLLERLDFVKTRENGEKIDYYLTKTAIDFLIDHGYLLG